MTPVIPSKAHRIVQRDTAFALHRERNLIERFFGKLEGFRAIATRHDTLAGTFLAAIQLVFVPCGRGRPPHCPTDGTAWSLSSAATQSIPAEAMDRFVAALFAMTAL
jgi:hypothetical protein